jgi:hypothetical protein
MDEKIEAGQGCFAFTTKASTPSTKANPANIAVAHFRNSS